VAVLLLARTIVLVGVLCATAQPASAQVEGSTRTRVDVRTPPWNSVGKLQAVSGSLRTTCTAALIGPRTVLSAAHCLFNARTGRYFVPGSLHFVAALEGGAFAAAALARSIEPAPDYDPSEPRHTRGSDWAVIELAGPVSSAGPPLPLAPAVPAAGTEVMVGGYAQDNPNVLTADTFCRVTGLAEDARGRRLLRHDCAATHGVSGAPLLVRTDAGWTIVGINVARSRSGDVGLATTLEGVAARQ
jgi:protease YdgD